MYSCKSRQDGTCQVATLVKRGSHATGRFDPPHRYGSTDDVLQELVEELALGVRPFVPVVRKPVEIDKGELMPWLRADGTLANHLQMMYADLSAVFFFQSDSAERCQALACVALTLCCTGLLGDSYPASSGTCSMPIQRSKATPTS